MFEIPIFFFFYVVYTTAQTIKLLENDLKALLVEKLIGIGTRNIVFSTSDPDIIVRMSVSTDSSHNVLLKYKYIFEILLAINDDFVKNIATVWWKSNPQLELEMQLASYNYVKDEFKKSIEFTQTPNLHLSVLPPIYQFDIMSEPKISLSYTSDIFSVIFHFQFNKKFPGDLLSRNIQDWQPLDTHKIYYLVIFSPN